MSLILNIETSTSVCSVALSEGEEVVFEKASFEGPSHAALLGVYMEEALEAAKSKGMKLDAVDPDLIRDYASGCLWLKDYALGMVFL